MNAVSRDLADAVGGDAFKVRVLALERGSIRVHTALDPGVCGDKDPLKTSHNKPRTPTPGSYPSKRGASQAQRLGLQ